MSSQPRATAKSAIAERIASSRGPVNRLKARRYGLEFLMGKPPTLELYFEPGDPHSHLAMQALAEFRNRVNTEIQVQIVPPPLPETYPEEEKQRAFALDDAIAIAPAWGLEFDHWAKLPSDETRMLAARLLLATRDINALIERERNIRQAVFSDDIAQLQDMLNGDCPNESTANTRMQANGKRRTWLGHYLPGMWQFNGEWFWGVDRLRHLALRLREHGLLEGDEDLLPFDSSLAYLPDLINLPKSLDFYFSFRSPYSYLAAVEVQQHYRKWPVALNIRPVLPMAMRGMSVPTEKRLYIVRDVKREADLSDIPFGRVADPIGIGAERCLYTFPLAEGVDQQLDFLVKAGTNIWSRGIDVATDEGLSHVCREAGIDWTAARARLDAGIDLSYAETNRQALFDAGYWGVPTFTLGSFSTWGRDRIWMIEELLRRLTNP